MAIKEDAFSERLNFEWSAVLAGAFIASAISIVFLQFGSAIGLTVDAPLRGEGITASWGIVVIGLWLLWTQLLASLAGGYVGGYLRSPTPEISSHENELRDGLYGFTVWATSTVAVFIVVSLASAFATYISILTEAYEAPEQLSDPEKNAAIIYAFIIGATSLLSATAAWWAGTMGGDHRSKTIDFSAELSFRKK